MASEKTIYERALKRWGLGTQIEMCIEELSELIQVLVKYGREINGSNREMIAEEVADSELMIEQMKVGFNIHKLVEDYKIKKIKRLEEFLK